MKLVFLGPPGAGKGTLAKGIADQLGIPHISTGDIIRGAIASGSDLGKKVKDIVDSGALVPDGLTIALVDKRLKEADAKKGFILDGFPRTVAQADALASMTQLEKVISFEIAEQEIVRRLSGRRFHIASGRSYHVEFNPPKVEGKDDVTGEDLIIRKDDQKEAIEKRLEVYKAQTAPLIEYYTKAGLLVSLDASPAPETVKAQALEIIHS